MPSPKRGPRLGGGPAHQKLMLAGMASDLFRHGRIKTTHTKAKTLRPYAEKLITKAKQGDLHARRQVLSKLRDRDVVAYLFEDVAPRFADRNGGYTRILKLGPRPGDNAPMALIELVDMGDRSGDEAIEVEKSRRSRGLFGRRRKRQDTDVSVGDQGAAAATIADALEQTPEDVADETDAPADTDEGVEAQAPADTEVSAPDDETVGEPADTAGDEPDAGGATGKDAGRS